MTLPGGERVSGERLRPEINYGRGATVFTEGKPRESSDPRNLFWLGYPMVVLHNLDGVPLHFGLDTGARDTILKENIRHKVALGPVRVSGGMSIGAGGLDGITRRKVDDLSFMSGDRLFRFESMSMQEGVKDLAVIEADGRLGSDVAYGGKMLIDFVNGRFELDVSVRK